MPRMPFPAGFLFSSVLWKHGEQIRKQEEERSFRFWAPQQWTLLAAVGRRRWGRRDGLAAAASPGVCSSGKGRISRESCRCRFRDSDLWAQAASRSLHLTPSIAFPWRPLLSPFYFSLPSESFVSDPLYLKYLAWFCFPDWTLPDTFFLALTTPKVVFGVEIFTQTTLISPLYPTSRLDIGKEQYILAHAMIHEIDRNLERNNVGLKVENPIL